LILKAAVAAELSPHLNYRFGIFLCLPLFAASLQAVERRPNVLVIITDDQRWDAMSCVGHSIPKTLNLDQLRREPRSK